MLDEKNINSADYVGTIEAKIKAQFGTKEAFCTKMGYDYKNFAKKVKTA